jgi:hypothetical protein
MSTPTNNKIWTWSGWVKRGSLTSNNYALFGAYDGTSTYSAFLFFSATTDALGFQYGGSSANGSNTTAVYRDPAAWYHVVWSVNAIAGTSIVYVNGVQAGSTSIANVASQINSTISHTIGRVNSNYYFDGEQTEINFVDGQALTPNSFGTFNSYGVWQPITYGGSYGTNGFYLPFNGTTASTYAGGFNGSTQYLINNSASSISTQFSAVSGFTLEAWVYPNDTSRFSIFFVSGGSYSSSGTNGVRFGLSANYSSTTQFLWTDVSGGGLVYLNGTNVTTNAWNHIAVGYNGSTTNLWVNGVSVATNSTNGYSSGPSSVTQFNIGSAPDLTEKTNGQISNLRYVKGIDIYGVNNSTITVPTTPLTAVSGTSLLTLQDATIIDNSTNAYSLTNTGSVTTSASTKVFTSLKSISSDQSSQGNNWKTNNISLVSGTTYDSMTDVPTLTSATAANTATFNPLDYVNSNTSSLTLTNGNLLVTRSTNSYGGYPVTIPLPTSAAGGGKFAFEFTAGTAFNGSTTEAYIGIAVQSNGTFTNSSATGYANDYYTCVNITGGNGYVQKKISGGAVTNVYTGGSAIAANDVFQFLVDMTNGTVDIKKNGSAYGTQLTGLPTTLALFPYVSMYTSTSAVSMYANFGQQPYASTPTTGYVALNTYNL